MSRILLIGATGQTGKILRRLLAERGRSVVGTGMSHAGKTELRLDLADADRVAATVREVRPEAVLIPGGWTNVDECEERPEEAMAVNAEGPGRAAEEAARLGAHVVYFSTDYVFDGEAGPYAEDAEPRPLGHYGRSKLEGERRVRASGGRHAVLRTCGVYSYDPGGRNFFMRVYGALSQGREQKAFLDQRLTPTYAEGLARAAAEAVERRLEGILHFAGGRLVSRVEYCRELARQLGFDPALVRPVRTADVPLKARRPLRAGLAVTPSRSPFRTPLPDLAESFRRIRAQIR